MKTLVSLANVGMIIWLGYLFFDDPSGGRIVLALILLFGLNTYLISFAPKENDWLSLFFRRKMLEERKKIENLEGKD